MDMYIIFFFFGGKIPRNVIKELENQKLQI